MSKTPTPNQERRKTAILLLAVIAVFLLLAVDRTGLAPTSYIIQAPTIEEARAAVASVNGVLTHELGVISAVGASLSEVQAAHLADNANLTLIADRSVAVAGWGTSSDYDTHYPTLVGADQLHDIGYL